MTITNFSPAILKALRPEIDAALAAVGERHGITLRAGNGSYGGPVAHFKLEMKAAGADEAAKAESLALLKSACDAYGLDADKVSVDGFKLTGYDAKRRAKPFLMAKPAAPDKVYIVDLTGARLRFSKKAA